MDVHVQHKEKLAQIITYENGKPLRDALVEIETSIKAYDWFSEEAKRTYGDIIPSPAANKRLLVVKQPFGVCGFLTPVSLSIIIITEDTSSFHVRASILRIFEKIFKIQRSDAMNLFTLTLTL